MAGRVSLTSNYCYVKRKAGRLYAHTFSMRLSTPLLLMVLTAAIDWQFVPVRNIVYFISLCLINIRLLIYDYSFSETLIKTKAPLYERGLKLC